MKHTPFSLLWILLLGGCAHPPADTHIREMVYTYDHVEDFVHWLKIQPGIGDVSLNEHLLLTTSPPQVVVIYFRYGKKNKLLIAVEPEKKLRLVKPEQ